MEQMEYDWKQEFAVDDDFLYIISL